MRLFTPSPLLLAFVLYYDNYYVRKHPVTPRQRNRLGLKLVLYYTALVAFVVLLISLFPQIRPLLPFGGLDELQQRTDMVTETDLVNLITHVEIPLDLLAHGVRVTLSMLGALLLMIPVRWVYLAVGDLEVADGGGGVHGDSRTKNTACIEDPSGDPVDEPDAAACTSSSRWIGLFAWAISVS